MPVTRQRGSKDMDFAQFLAARGASCGLRKRLWTLLQTAEHEAQSALCGPQNTWIPISEVVEGGPDWSEGGRITIPVSVNDLGVVFHEVFHSAFHHSPLWHDPNNCHWGDAFCDAFRYFMERCHLTGTSHFLQGMTAELGKADSQVKVENDRYKGWASRIVIKCNQDYDRFKAIWIERNANYQEPLSVYFGL